jgi:hypothetical protein
MSFFHAVQLRNEHLSRIFPEAPGRNVHPARLTRSAEPSSIDAQHVRRARMRPTI